jgi:hypothetical protein
MMRIRWFGGMMVLAAALAACGDQGGELREATERRRAEGIDQDPLAADTGTAAGEPGRLPAFVLTDSAARAGTPAAQTPADTGQGAPQTPAQPELQEWTAGVLDAVRTMRAPVVLRDVRVGVNQGFDRVVLEFLGSAAPGYRVEYIDRPVRQCGSGEPTGIAGDAWLSITLRGAQAHTDAGQPTVTDRERRLRMPVVQELEFVCDFEGVVQVVLGVASPNRFRVVELQNPTRLIVDVQQ